MAKACKSDGMVNGRAKRSPVTGWGIEGLLGGLVVGDGLCCPPVAVRRTFAFDRAILPFSSEEQDGSRSGGPQA